LLLPTNIENPQGMIVYLREWLMHARDQLTRCSRDIHHLRFYVNLAANVYSVYVHVGTRISLLHRVLLRKAGKRKCRQYMWGFKTTHVPGVV